jgi:hypothetical protein
MKKKLDRLANRFSLDDLAELYDLPSQNALDELNWEYVADAGSAAYDEVLRESRRAERRAEKARVEAETAAQRELFLKWRGAVEAAVASVLEAHDLELIAPAKRMATEPYRIEPQRSWREAADRVRETISGVGYFSFDSLREFLDSGPYTAREAVLTHLRSMGDYGEVYGTARPQAVFDRAFR